MMKKKIIICILVLAVVLAVAVAANATTTSKQINATYRNIVIMANGTVVTAEPGLGEPFIVTDEGRTYVPIRMAAQALGLTVDWVELLNAVKITGSTSSTELEALKTENAALKAKIAKLEEDSGGDLSDLEETLIDDYDTLGDVDIDDLTLDGDEDDVEVTIEVDLADFNSEWDDLSNSEIENFIEDIVNDIQDEFSEDTMVTGEIIDIDNDDTLVEFDKDGTDDLNVEINGSSGDEDDALNELEDKSYDVDDMEFTISTISYNEDDDSVTLKLTSDDDVADGWEALDDDGDLEVYVIDICEDIVDVFDEEAGIDLESINIRFSDENGSLDSYEYDVDSGDLN
jgi:hypothetical protein